jgi:hypothetical protein
MLSLHYCVAVIYHYLDVEFYWQLVNFNTHANTDKIRYLFAKNLSYFFIVFIILYKRNACTILSIDLIYN